jgi:hypothetical protein
MDPTTDEPTFAPSHTPTEVPTPKPTHTPTYSPTAAPTQEPTAPACKDVLLSDVVLAVDSSGSISNGQWDQFMNFIDKLTNDFPIAHNGMHLGAVQFATTSYKYGDLTGDKQAAKDARKKMKPRGDGKDAIGMHTNMHLAVDEILSMDGRQNVVDVIVVLTDGMPTGGVAPGSSADLAFQRAREMGVKVLFVLIGHIFQWVKPPMRWMSAPPLQINNFAGLDGIRSQVVDMVCKEVQVSSAPIVRSTKTDAPLAPIVVLPPPVIPETLAPLVPPTENPTVSPTEAPTDVPSGTPTEEPTTKAPSPSPSHTPTEPPTSSPSRHQQIPQHVVQTKCAGTPRSMRRSGPTAAI